MSSRTTRAAAALLATGALVLSVNSLGPPSVATPDLAAAPSTTLDVDASGSTYRARPFGPRIAAGKAEYFTVKVPRSGNYRVAMTGLIAYEATPASASCFVVDLEKILDDDYSGYYLVSTSESDSVFDNGLNEVIDVDLKKSRRILLSCSSTVDLEVLKPITVTFQRNGPFKNLSTKPYQPPSTSPGDLLDDLR